MTRLYQPGKECHIEFDLGGMPNDIISQAYLDQLALHLKFESILKYVALPALSVERSSSSNKIVPQSRESNHPRGLSDLVAVLEWLWRNGVREIIKVMVIDDRERPHADTAIVEALYAFKAEEWDWKGVDLCSDVIYKGSPTVREASLYCSGNNAVLMGWASAEGLGNCKKFPLLEQINIYRNVNNCKVAIEKRREKGLCHKGFRVKIIPDNNKKADSDHNDHVAPVKIAIIDDGIDATVSDLQRKIVGGATFCPYPHSDNLVNSYFLICRLCPDVQLYVARLEELPSSSGSGRRVTARSAAKAVNWAVNCGVNIISMSWTIQTAAPDNEDMKNLQEAINRAHSTHILMFCSASDQGGHTPERCYPGDWGQCLRIGGATFAGDKLTWVDEKVDFWFPGRNVPFLSSDGKSMVYESGSSVATAAASGLAAVLIYAARLVDGNETRRLQDRDELQNAFRNMSSGSDQKFPRSYEFLYKLFGEKWWKEKSRQTPGIERGNRTLPIETIMWDAISKSALKDLMDHIQAFCQESLKLMPYRDITCTTPT
ncbi:peptidase S8/S53 domain-containing protein [Xylariaceae sp. FL0255]|nr:peptidase S8/S53 domain-containing protein [Xylariaceae sp. FL0255]